MVVVMAQAVAAVEGQAAPSQGEAPLLQLAAALASLAEARLPPPPVPPAPQLAGELSGQQPPGPVVVLLVVEPPLLLGVAGLQILSPAL